MRSACWSKGGGRRRNRGRGARSRFPAAPIPARARWLCLVLAGLAAAAAATGPAAAVSWAGTPAEAGAEEPQPPATCCSGEPVRIVVVDLETGEELWSASARAGDEIWYTYTHSADKTPVQSLLRVEAPPVGLVLVLERYLWYGAGLEFRSDRGVYLDGRWVVVEAERAVGRLPLRVAGTVEQEIIVGQNRTTLSELAEYGARVMLEVRP